MRFGPLAKLAACAAAGLVFAVGGLAASGAGAAAKPSPIVIGETTALSGFASAFGQANIVGQQAIFRAVNAAGGVNGHQITFKVIDDALNTATALQNCQTLAATTAVAILEGAGSNGIDACSQYLSTQKVPFLFPGRCTPANSYTAYTYCLTPTYPDQISAVIAAAFKKFGKGSVYLIDTPSSAQAEEEAIAQSATLENGGAYLGVSTVPFGAPDVTPFVLQATRDHPQFILFETAPADTTRVVAALAAGNELPERAILGLTSLPGNTYLQGVPASAQALTYTLGQTSPPGGKPAQSCVAALKKYFPSNQLDIVNLFGCAMAQATVAALKLAGKNPTRASLNKVLMNLKKTVLSPLEPPVTFTPSHHMGLTALPALEIKNGAWTQVGTVPVPARAKA
jgi:ABC-type branched-subunit amino acid transport system substrate-binding protein